MRANACLAVHLDNCGRALLRPRRFPVQHLRLGRRWNHFEEGANLLHDGCLCFVTLTAVFALTG